MQAAGVVASALVGALAGIGASCKHAAGPEEKDARTQDGAATDDAPAAEAEPSEDLDLAKQGAGTVVSNGAMQVRFNRTRFGAAIDSLVFRGKQFVDATDHGRELQIAWQNDGHYECYNPTEAGSAADGRKTTSSSKVLQFAVNGTAVHTASLPAYWSAPNTKLSYCRAINKTVRTTSVLYKDVQIGVGGYANVMHVAITLDAKEPLHQFRIEAPTLYTPGDFNQQFLFDPASGALNLIGLDQNNREWPMPVVLSTADGQFATSAYSPDLPEGTAPNNAYLNFRTPVAAPTTNKWSVIYYREGGAGQYHFQAYVIVGNREEVRQTLVALYAHHGA